MKASLNFRGGEWDLPSVRLMPLSSPLFPLNLASFFLICILLRWTFLVGGKGGRNGFSEEERTAVRFSSGGLSNSSPGCFT